ncbi:MAG: MerR family transcriptional regulator [Chloroflexi bacterium]|nr:MerR family transcriptional regulator [Chloroflexota bacterium]
MAEVVSLQIGDVARKAGVSLRTVRYYEELGLLIPSGRTSGGMRLYIGRDVTRLRFIRRLRMLHLSLDEVKVALGLEQPPATRQERIAHTLDVLQMEDSRASEQMALLDDLRREVNEALTNVKKCTECTAGKCPESCPSRAYLL